MSLDYLKKQKLIMQQYKICLIMRESILMHTRATSISMCGRCQVEFIAWMCNILKLKEL